MATTRIKDLSKTATTVNSDANLVLDGNTGGTQKITRDNFRQDTADAFVAAPGTYNLAPINSGTGKIAATYLPTSSDTPKGPWNASTNTPPLAAGSGTAGDYYDVTVAGSSDLGSGSITFTVGDVVKYNGTTWFKIDSVTNILDGVSTIDGAKAGLEIPDGGTAPDVVPLNGQLGSMAYQDADSVSVDKLEVTSTTGTSTTQAIVVKDSSGTKLAIQEDGSIKGDLRVIDDGGTNTLGLLYDNGTEGILDLRANNVTKIELRTAGNSYFNGGNVGIGTASPGNPLEVAGTNGNFSIAADGNTANFSRNAANYIAATADTSSALAVLAKHSFQVHTGASTTERLRVDSGGNLILTKGGGAYLQLKDASAVRGAINVGTSDGLIFTTGASFTEKMRLDGDGLKFNGDTAAANALSDYEEGTATVSFVPDGGTVTIKSTHNTLYYRKVGNLVHIAGELVVDSVSSPTGEFKISGLPYASENVNNNRSAISIHTSLLSSSSRLAAFVEKNQNYASVRLTGSTGYGQTSATVLQANTGIVIGGSYHTA